jgi:hypothetical protein
VPLCSITPLYAFALSTIHNALLPREHVGAGWWDHVNSAGVRVARRTGSRSMKGGVSIGGAGDRPLWRRAFEGARAPQLKTDELLSHSDALIRSAGRE